MDRPTRVTPNNNTHPVASNQRRIMALDQIHSLKTITFYLCLKESILVMVVHATDRLFRNTKGRKQEMEVYPSTRKSRLVGKQLYRFSND